MAHHASRAASRLPSSVVATVAGHPVTLTAYHTLYENQKRAALAGGTPLDPPGYSRCSAALAREYAHNVATLHLPKKRRPPTPSHAALVKECAAREAGIGQGAMTQLIQQQWTQLAAQADGITVSSAAVNAALAQQKRAIGGAAAYGRYLARAGETVQQAAAAMRLSLLEQRLQQRRLGPAVNVTAAQVAAFFAAHHAEFVLPGQPHPKLATYATRIRLLLSEQARAKHTAAASTAYEQHWRSLTICRAGYVVPLCANT